MLKLDETTIERLHDTLMHTGRATIFAHTHPDGDAVGCTSALAMWLAGFGISARVILPDKVSSNIEFMTRPLQPMVFSEDESACKEWMRESDLLVCMDCNSPDRTSAKMQEALESNTRAVKVLIDHHLNPDEDAFDILMSTPEISSASELLFWVLLAMPEVSGDAAKLSREVREALLAGMTTDTNNFANSVFPSTLEMASKLIEAGTDRDAILSEIYNQYRENRLRLMGKLLGENMRITPSGAAYMLVTKELMEEYDIRPGETEGFVNMPLSLAKVHVSLFLKEDELEDGVWRVSIRSKRGTSANALATKYFHGGGHELASGGKLRWPGDIDSRDDAAAYVEKVTEVLA